MARAGRRRPMELDDINLVPIMSIMVILIPMLIYAFTFFEVTVQSVAAPKMGTGRVKKTDEENPERPLNLTVLINDDGFLLKYDEGEVAGGAEQPLIKKRRFKIQVTAADDPTKKVEVEVWDYDYPALHNKLAALKAKYEKEELVNIGASMHIPWQVLARTIDAARLQLEGAPFDHGDELVMALYQKARPVTVKEKVSRKLADGTEVVEEISTPVMMFPRVVFVVAE